MNPAHGPLPDADDPRLLAVVQEYLQALEAGRRPDRREFTASHPELSEALTPYLDALDALHPAAPPLNSSSSVDLFAPATMIPPPAEPLGDFRLVREIGRGGMGVVYEAVQRSLGRRVALKVLPFAAALDAKQLQRFKNEAQAAAHLHHPHIVPVYAVGAERGVHYYAMQLIDGQNLASLIDGLRGSEETRDRSRSGRSHDSSSVNLLPPPVRAAATETRSNLGARLSTQRSEKAGDYFRAVARLIAQAAEGLDHAHSLGVVHRDVKPANLLVDAQGAVWVTDFGLAQFHADAGLTQTGDLLGTLRYMSPEQAGGPRGLLDHRTDVYSLGATLYELLTLQPIFDGADRQTLLRQILHEEPRPPRALNRSIPAELETVVLKALAKAPAERYATARDFADDLGRFLRHEPVRARRATPVQRARKWLRRHPAVSAAGVVTLLLVAVGSLISAALIRDALERERQRAVEAEDRFQLARRSVDGMVQLAEEELADKPHMEGLRKRLLEATLIYYQEFIEQRRDDPAAQAELEATRDRVKKIIADLAVLQGAGQFFLLTNPVVLDDLQADREQRAGIAELSRRMAEEGQKMSREFGRLTPEERRQRFLDLVRANEAGVARVLRADQIKRLRQIAFQLQGLRAFKDPDMIAKLELTAGQRERIRTIEANLFFPSAGPPSQTLPKKSPEDLWKAALAQIRALLTEEQLRRWQEMTGASFTGPAPGSFPGPPRSFGPPG